MEPSWGDHSTAGALERTRASVARVLIPITGTFARYQRSGSGVG